MRKRAWIVAVAFIALSLFAGSCREAPEPPPEGMEGMGAASSNGDLPQLVDLGSTTCVPCKAMAPILDELGATFAGQFEVVFIDVREDGDAAEQYGISIIPTQIFLDADGNELYRHQGFLSRDDILAKWAELGYEFRG
jgi:thioredoxin 1